MERYFLNIADFVIKISFLESEHVNLKSIFLKQFEEIWGKGNFIIPETEKVDAEISVRSPEGNLKLIFKKNSGEAYLLSRKRRGKRISAYYHAGLYAFELLLRDILEDLLKTDGFSLHASGVLNSRGVLLLFLAPREGGKSTLARLLSGNRYQRFSDDSVVVRKVSGKWKFYSTPFIEKDLYPKRMMSRKAKIFFIKKGSKAKIENIENKKKVVKMLLSQVWSKKGEFENRRLRLILNFVESNHFYQLTATLNAGEVEKVIDEN